MPTMPMRADDERVRAMLDGRRKPRIFDVPGLNGQADAKIGFRVLSDEEHADCKLNAAQYVKAIAETKRLTVDELLTIFPEVLDEEKDRQVLFKACVVAEPDSEGKHAPFFDSPKRIAQADTVWVRMLYDIYIEHQDYVNPYVQVDEEKAQELADTMGKASELGVPLSQYDVRFLLILLRTLANRLVNSPTPKSSTGTSPEASTTSS